MEVSKTYNPAQVEDKWYAYWLEKGFFASKPNPDKEPFTIVIPPPNVTGVLHMGHILNNTLQDILIRKARMEGKEALWVAGTDHASIATEARVVRMLREKGIKKGDLTREQFLEYAWEWKEKYGGIILEQLKKLGASCDWDRTRFTMDTNYYKAVIKVFVDLYNKGFIYRGLRMINWDCEAKTALSNEEVIHNENGEQSTLYHVRYQIQDSDEFIVIATQRPETIMGDVAIAVNPDDERYTHLLGKKALVPFINRPIPIIADSYVEKDFGTGCLKVTPAHDQNDYEIGQRHNLPVIDTINFDGTLNELCEIPKFVGKDRFEVRKRIIKDLREAELLVKEENFVTKIGRSERTNSVVEPKLSIQWFIRMKDISKRALEAVENDEIKLHPAKFKNVYRHWMENVRDWCISRQLWWGHRIPAYYFGEGENDFVVAENIEQALIFAKQKTNNNNLTINDLRQEEDVLDTWASSWLWPMAVFDGFEEYDLDKKDFSKINSELAYYYPTDVLVTAPEILFFWVARMIITGYEYMGDKPFKDVYLTGIVRDKQGRKMSKSLGNSPEPLDLMAKYSTDGVRTGMLFSAPAGNDLPFDEKLCEQGRNFCNKIWNAFRLVTSWEISQESPSEADLIATKWFESRLNESLAELEEHFNKFRISDALLSAYKLVWDDFCSWYLEMIKPEYGKPTNQITYNKTIDFLEKILKILHPFMPFITEELWHALAQREERDCIVVATYPKSESFDATLLKESALVFELITAIRNLRASKGISPKESFELFIKTTQNETIFGNFSGLIRKLANISDIRLTENSIEKSLAFMVRTDEFFVPFVGNIDTEAEKDKILKEIEYLKGFLESINKKLLNEKFVKNAKVEVVDSERKKQADALLKIEALEKSLAVL